MFMAQNNSGRALSSVLAIGLWLVATAGAVASIYWVRQLVLGGTMFFGGDIKTAEAITPLLVAFLGLVATVVIIASTEYHRRHFLEAGSWRLLAWMIGIEAALMIAQTTLVGF